MSEPNQNQTTTTTASARRRSSGLMPTFESLQTHKNSGESAVRRQSLSDQHVKGGVFHQLFHNSLGRNSK
ncbi:hypothetical protein HIM_08007 [Hirsutella minnesotensis 3608]|uniref:Conidiation-specific protein 8 n=1 Tax=Hirsutella minnesotensis 3608 TaxID=1043627 RepID=A0A0F7ZT80_9HYPO|nr:hypothetical protein HIM_08007 [Hirsutella minnesotensis 3608]